MVNNINFRSRNTLPFLIIQDGFVVYASQVFCRLHEIDSHIFGSSKIPMEEVFDNNELSFDFSLPNQKSLKQLIKKR